MEDLIIDTELVAFDRETNKYLPFQTLTQRSRKWVTEKDLDIKICICAFDLLYLNATPKLKEPHIVRRALLHQSLN